MVSKKIIGLGVGCLAIVLVAAWQLSSSNPVPTTDVRPSVTEANLNIGYRFDFPTGERGFYLDQSTDLNEPDGLRKALVLIPYSDLEAYWEPAEGAELPPVINIYVFDNVGNLSLREWVERFGDFSRQNLAVNSIEETTIAGANALRYEADGLYRANVIAIEQAGQVALLVGEFTDRDTQLFSDYWNIAASFSLSR